MNAPSQAIELDAQYRAMREEAGVLDRSGRGKLEVSGPEAAEYLQGQLTNEIESLAPGSGGYAALLDRKGHIQADMRVLRLDQDGFWLDTEPAATAGVMRHLGTYKVGREVDVRDVSEKWSIISVIGPRAAEVAGGQPPPGEHAQVSFDRGGIQVRAVATDLGLDLIVPAQRRDRMIELVQASGALPVSEQAAEIVRVESGRPRFGLDFGPEAMPAEAGIVDRAVDFEKGCYIGQEPVARLHYRGRPNRSLRGLRLSAESHPGAPLSLGEREVGRIGTAVVSPRLGPIALAVVRREAELGSELAVGEDGVTAIVSPSDGFG